MANSFIENAKAQGKLNKLLGLPFGKKVEDQYKTGEALAGVLVKKIGQAKAKSMLELALKNTGKAIYKAAIKSIDVKDHTNI